MQVLYFQEISYIISWSFNIQEFKRIKYFSKTVKIKGWAPSVRNDKLISNSSPRRDSKNSKEKFKRRLEETLLNLNTDMK